MNYRLIDDYISEVTKDMGAKQQGEAAKELRAHILDSADALAAERKTAVDDVIIGEVLTKMGPADRVAAMYPKPKLTRSGRPKMVPPLSKIDLVIEAIALIGFLLNLGLIIYGLIKLPETIPKHVGLSGGIDSYGNKLVLLSVFLIGSVSLYLPLTIVNRYPYIFNFPTIVTEENAPRLYRLARSMICWLKAIFAWTFALAAWEFVLVLPYDPGQSVNSSLILFISIIAMTIVSGYYIIKIIMVSKSRSTTIENG